MIGNSKYFANKNINVSTNNKMMVNLKVLIN